MNKYQWFRKLRGGLWVRVDSLGWDKIDSAGYRFAAEGGLVREDWTR